MKIGVATVKRFHWVPREASTACPPCARQAERSANSISAPRAVDQRQEAHTACGSTLAAAAAGWTL
eukprot:12134025-Heterocapsa_arctica.AAC.1